MADGFVFYRSFFEAVDCLPDDVFCQVVKAIAVYALDGKEPELEGVSRSLFLMAKPQIDANSRRREAGAKGGRPRLSDEKPMVSESEKLSKPMVSEIKKDSEPKEKEKDKDKEKDKVKDQEKEVKEKEKPETASAMVDRLTAELGMSDDMRETLRTWVRYKTEKRQAYKAEGLRALIAQVHKAVQTYGEQAVISLVSDCMACGYQGIIFDRLRKDKPPDKKRTKFDNFPSHGTDYDALMWASVSGGIK